GSVDRPSRPHARIVFRVLAEGGDVQRRQLTERQVDFVITRKHGPIDAEHVSFEFLFESPYFVVAGANSPWVRRRRIALAGLADELWALPAQDHWFGGFVAEAFRASGLGLSRQSGNGYALEIRAYLLNDVRFVLITYESCL